MNKGNVEQSAPRMMSTIIRLRRSSTVSRQRQPVPRPRARRRAAIRSGIAFDVPDHAQTQDAKGMVRSTHDLEVDRYATVHRDHRAIGAAPRNRPMAQLELNAMTTAS